MNFHPIPILYSNVWLNPLWNLLLTCLSPSQILVTLETKKKWSDWKMARRQEKEIKRLEDKLEDQACDSFKKMNPCTGKFRDILIYFPLTIENWWISSLLCFLLSCLPTYSYAYSFLLLCHVKWCHIDFTSLP